MKLLMIPITILIATGSAWAGKLPGDHSGFLMAAAEHVSNPWATIPLLLVGMLLIISELMRTSHWRALGMGGALCLGAVVASHAALGAVSGMGLLLAGLALMLVETHLLPGRVIGVLCGLGGIFAGMFMLLAGTSSDIVYPLIVSSIVTFLSAIAFLVYLPNNLKWRTLSRNARVAANERLTDEIDFVECPTPTRTRASMVEIENEETPRQQTVGHDED